MVAEKIPQDVALGDVDVWFQDETRVGQQGSRTRIWAKTGTRPRVVKQQQFLYQYIFGAVCPSQKTAAAIVAPYANHHSLQEHLKEISTHVPKRRHAVVVMDQAGWHKTKELNIPENISILHLPPYSPELNPQENVWQYLKDHFLANRTFDSLQEILIESCNAWNQFVETPTLIQSLTSRKWALIN